MIRDTLLGVPIMRIVVFRMYIAPPSHLEKLLNVVVSIFMYGPPEW